MKTPRWLEQPRALAALTLAFALVPAWFASRSFEAARGPRAAKVQGLAVSERAGGLPELWWAAVGLVGCGWAGWLPAARPVRRLGCGATVPTAGGSPPCARVQDRVFWTGVGHSGWLACRLRDALYWLLPVTVLRKAGAWVQHQRFSWVAPFQQDSV